MPFWWFSNTYNFRRNLLLVFYTFVRVITVTTATTTNVRERQARGGSSFVGRLSRCQLSLLLGLLLLCRRLPVRTFGFCRVNLRLTFGKFRFP